MDTDWTSDVLEFARKFGHHVEPLPAVPPTEVVTLRRTLLREEFKEFMAAILDAELPAIAKEGCDLIYVIVGAMIAHGIDPRPCWNAVHFSNMTKSQEKRADGKSQKGPGYVAVDMAAVLADQNPLLNILPPQDEAEAQRLYQELQADIAAGNAWGMRPEEDV